MPHSPFPLSSSGENGPWIHEEYKFTFLHLRTCIYARGLKDIFYDPGTATLLLIQCLEEWQRLLEVLVIMRGMCFKTLSTLIVSHIASAVSSLHSAFMCLFPPWDTCVKFRTDSASEAIY